MITAILALAGGTLAALVVLGFVVWGVRRKDEGMIIIALVFGAPVAGSLLIEGFQKLEKWEAAQAHQGTP